MGIQGTLGVQVDAGRGYAAMPLAGTALTSAQQTTLQQRVEASLGVVQAIADAMALARRGGQTGFRAADAQAFQLPAGVTNGQRDAIFNEVIGRPWGGGEMTLAQWARASAQLEQWVAQARSSLPPGAGGGAHNANGQWYVNGQAFSMVELFTATRVNTYLTLDEQLNSSLNTIAANNRLVNSLVRVLKAGRDPATSMSQNARQLVAQYGYYAGAVWASAARPDAVSWDQVRELALNLIGSNSKLAYSISTNPPNAGGLSLGNDDWKTAMDELATIIDSKTADNQVAQQRMESVMTARANLLDGLGSMLKGQQNMNSSVNRNL